MKKAILTPLFILCLQLIAQAQQVEMATDLRSSGKIYIVVAVLCVLFIGLAIYLFTIDKKVSKIEKGIQQK